MATGTHEYVDDPRNAEIAIYINGEFFPREEAKVSVFDSGFVLGDGVWEGLRVYNGKIFCHVAPLPCSRSYGRGITRPA